MPNLLPKDLFKKFKPKMSNKALLIVGFCLIVFIFGLYVYTNNKIRFETFSETLRNKNNEEPECPNLLVKRGEHIYLYNTTDRSNSIPIHFNNLDEYIEYVNYQRSQGINCPILFLQNENDAQGNDVYRVRPSPFDQQGGMQPVGTTVDITDPRIISGDYNKNLYTGFDPYGQDIGVYTTLDEIHDSTADSNKSDNPMDTNWGGVHHTLKEIESGKYEDRQVTKPTYFTPKDQFFKGLGNRAPPLSFISSSGVAI